MPNTYSKIYIHYVFAVHSRDTSLDVQWRESLYQYIGGIVRKRKQQMIANEGESAVLSVSEKADAQAYVRSA